jgi:hypothetical protein
LARGFDVVATDPADNAAANLRAYVDTAWPQLAEIGLSQGASPDRCFTKDMQQALGEAAFVQENGTPSPGTKRLCDAQHFQRSDVVARDISRVAVRD